ncbi:MAG: hypothetical protein ABIE42_09240 [Candidatus Eisenbacteria bacterium]
MSTKTPWIIAAAAVVTGLLLNSSASASTKSPPKKPAPKKPPPAPAAPSLAPFTPTSASYSFACQAARIAFESIRAATQAANPRKLRPLSSSTIDKLRPLFPKLDLGRVRVAENATIPAREISKLNIPGAASDIDAMTFGYDIYMKGKASTKLLVHECVHVDQVRRYGGRDKFACAYGNGVVRGGMTYRGNPLEVEAYGFADKAMTYLCGKGLV